MNYARCIAVLLLGGALSQCQSLGKNMQEETFCVIDIEVLGAENPPEYFLIEAELAKGQARYSYVNSLATCANVYATPFAVFRKPISVAYKQQKPCLIDEFKATLKDHFSWTKQESALLWPSGIRMSHQQGYIIVASAVKRMPPKIIVDDYADLWRIITGNDTASETKKRAITSVCPEWEPILAVLAAVVRDFYDSYTPRMVEERERFGATRPPPEHQDRFGSSWSISTLLSAAYKDEITGVKFGDIRDLLKRRRRTVESLKTVMAKPDRRSWSVTFEPAQLMTHFGDIEELVQDKPTK